MSGAMGFRLNDISNVLITPELAHGDRLIYSEATGKWGNVQLAASSPVAVTATWATAANAKTDVESATGITFPADSALWDIFVVLWEGPDDPDDFAVLLAKDTPSFTAQNGEAAGFTSAPTSGSAYILGFAMNKVIE